jgi:alpha-tubulin suppressor-like RCC1 family protein
VYQSGTCGAGPTCSGSGLVGQSMCMNGACVAPAAQACPDNFACSGMACKTSCLGAADCAFGYTCVRGACVQFVDVTVGESHACSLLSNGTVRCWGHGEGGQLGDGANTSSSVPVAVSNLSGVRAIAAGHIHTCAIRDDNTVWCWGNGQLLQFGMGIPAPGYSTVPLQATSLTGLRSIASDSAVGWSTNCGVHTSGSVKCWGNEGGYLGSIVSTNAMAVGVSQDHQCALVSSNPMSLTCSGSNNYRQSDSQPFSSAVGIAVGDQFTCVMLLDGTIKCQGVNDRGQAGTGSFASPVLYGPVKDLSGATAVAARRSYVCALISGGTMKCWGSLNSLLGISSTPVPVAISSLSNVTSFGLGTQNLCVIEGRNTIKCCGNNDDGQLGNGTTSPFQSNPVTVTGW